MDVRLIKIVVLAHPGSEPLVRDIWEHFCDAPVVVWTDVFGSVKEVLEAVMADNEIDAEFVLVPANLVPVSKVLPGEFQTPLVDVVNQKKVLHWGRVPVLFSKERLADFLPDNDPLEDNEFVKAYLKANNMRPLEVAHGFGNYFTKVIRGNPCENVVIEALVRKRFLYVNQAGWPAIEHLLKKLLGND
jgi:hypothetical protein